jgi:hypothetical protein
VTHLYRSPELEGGDGCTDPSIMAGEDGWRAMGASMREIAAVR